MNDYSPLQLLRRKYVPRLPKILKDLKILGVEKGELPPPSASELKQIFPLTIGRSLAKFVRGKGELNQKPQKIGVVFSGGQAPGGHNVISGLFDAMKGVNEASELFGFLEGPSGIVKNKVKKLEGKEIDAVRNQGGFDLIGSGRTKIESEEQLKASFETCKSLDLDGLVVVGGDDSNTNAALLAEYFAKMHGKTAVVGVPKTIDGDLKNQFVDISFGFDTACRVYSEAIGNILKDALSAKKYTHFIKLMGRSASHITLECALQTHPNMALIGEEVAFEKKTLAQITTEVADLICRRSENGKNYGCILIPEGLIEFIPEMGELIAELNRLAANHEENFIEKLSPQTIATYNSLPKNIQQQLLQDRDPHGNLQVTAIETEKLLISTVKEELERRAFKGSFSPLAHFFGYEGRASLPTNFDCNYCYTLGFLAFATISFKLSGSMCYVKGITKDVDNWEVGAIPLAQLIVIEERKGKKKPVIQKALVDLQGFAFKKFKEMRSLWAEEDHYRVSGPIQYCGDKEICESFPISILS